MAVLVCCCITAIGLSSTGGTSTTAQDVDLEKAKFLGAEFCKTCHEKPQPIFKTDFVQLTEFDTWKKRDKHSQGYATLTEPRAQRMGELLGIDVTGDKSCLNCHAMNFPKERYSDSFTLQDGVSCDGCHGPAEHWLTSHTQQTWRRKPATEKAKLGMINVRDPIRRSELCLSCHIGSVAEEKVITHAMYAAGHPPLPAFESATFSEALPRHWRYLSEKSPEIQALFQFDPNRLEQAELLVVGGAVAIREAAKLMASETTRGHWPDFAQFDCYACHHELKRPSWRVERDQAGAPGRPQAQSWPTALVELAIRCSTDNEAQAEQERTRFTEKVRHLHEAFAERPFGNPDKIASAARELAEWADQLIAKLDGRPLDRDRALALLRSLSAWPQAAVPDYDTARLTAWAFRFIYAQLRPKPEHDPQIREILARLDEQLDLSLLANTSATIEESLPKRLQAVGDYDPDKFRAQLAELVQYLR